MAMTAQEVQKALSNRLGRQMEQESQGVPVAEGAPAPAQGAPVAPAPSVTPVPAPPAPPPVPVAPVAPAPDPAVETLQRRFDALEAENVALRAERAAKPTSFTLDLPSKERLDEMPQGEALALVAQGVLSKVNSALESRIAPVQQENAALRQSVSEMRRSDVERAVKAQYPRLDLEKYRTQANAKMTQNRGLSLEEAIRLVADPADLLPAAPVAPTTPSAVVHMETGLPVRSGASAVPPARQEPDYVALSQLALKAGNTREHRRLVDLEISRRFSQTAPVAAR